MSPVVCGVGGGAREEAVRPMSAGGEGSAADEEAGFLLEAEPDAQEAELSRRRLLLTQQEWLCPIDGEAAAAATGAAV